MPNPILMRLFPQGHPVIRLDQLWQKGSEILLDGNICCVSKGILKVANNIILYITIMALIIIRPEKNQDEIP